MKTYGTSHAGTTVYLTAIAILTLSSSLARAQTPTCAAVPSPPGCNSVTTDGIGNTAMGSGSLANVHPGQSPFESAAGNTAAGDHALYSNTVGYGNTASGSTALYQNTAGDGNTAAGSQALTQNTTGSINTSSGYQALQGNTSGNANTASGSYALGGNTTGNNNTASGVEALFSNTTASGNTASGYRALRGNTTGTGNSALGNSALQFNVEGSENTASGALSLYSNTSGNYNAASGFEALFANTTASSNTASGYRALYLTTTGEGNTAIGFRALLSNTIGLNNIGVGTNAGYAVTGSNNIDIGSTGSAGESGVIRIGGPSQSATYIAGISSAHLTGSAVYVAANGQLGVLASSERYKTEIISMGPSTQKLRELRPVSFHLKSDPQGAVQYGLIAEEVAKVLPELVIRDDAGTIQGVRYDELAPMLLNEVQQQQKEAREQQEKLAAQASELGELKQQVAALQELTRRTQAALAEFQAKESAVAMR